MTFSDARRFFIEIPHNDSSGNSAIIQKKLERYQDISHQFSRLEQLVSIPLWFNELGVFSLPGGLSSYNSTSFLGSLPSPMDFPADSTSSRSTKIGLSN